MVRGLDGQVDLLLDRGRPLDGYSLRRAASAGPRPERLNALEKARLDARRVLLASQLAPDQQLERLVAIVRRRIPFRPDEEQTYARQSHLQQQRWGQGRLSEFVRRRTGVCRERAWLLAMLLDEANVRNRVRYGELYDASGNDLGGHAWVEARLGGQRLLVDPSRTEALQPVKSTLVEETLLDGRTRRVRAAVTAGLTYVPTDDLRRAWRGPRWPAQK